MDERLGKNGGGVDSQRRKRFFRIYFAVIITVFFLGGLTRGIQQAMNIRWLNGIVAIFGGLYIVLFGIPLLLVKPPNPRQAVKFILAWTAGLPLILIGLSIIIWGFASSVSALH